MFAFAGKKKRAGKSHCGVFNADKVTKTSVDFRYATGLACRFCVGRRTSILSFTCSPFPGQGIACYREARDRVTGPLRLAGEIPPRLHGPAEPIAGPPAP